MIAVLIAIFVIVGLPVIYLLVQYNALIGLRNYIRESWSNVDTELKRRYDLIPNLVAVVKGYATHEREVLERVGAHGAVRLACQLRPTGDIAVVPLLPAASPAIGRRPPATPWPGEERFIVVLVADMRDSTRLATTRLPFDAVFVIDRFVQAVSEAVTEAGGRANHFTGDGLIAAFGLACAPREACRQALAAVAGIGRNVAALNHALLGEMAEPIRFGVGVHGSVAVVGEIGFAEARVFTTLGDPANLATRLEQLCKQFACEAVVSDAVCRLSGRDLEYLPLHQAALRGRTAALPARLIVAAAALAEPAVVA